MRPLRQLIREIHRRSLWQVLVGYLVASWAMIAAAGTLGDALGLPDWFPRLALGLLIIGLPIVLATAFVQEGGPTRAPAPTEPTGQETRSVRKWLTWRNALGGGVLALALWGVVAAGWMLLGGASAAGGARDASVAVLPCANMSDDPENEYFSDGITEEVLNALAQLPGVRVPARTSSFAFKGRNIPISAIADTLGVAHVLECSVRRAEDRVLITAQFIDARTDTHLWSDTYERDLVDIFAIQREIAGAIADQLRVSLAGTSVEEMVADATESAEAYDLYLQGREYWNRPGALPANREAAIDLFARAVAIDPDFALARANLAIVHLARAWPGWAGYDRTPERLAVATEEATRALALEPNLPEGHLAMSYVHYWGNYDLLSALEELETAQALRPNDAEIIEARGFVHRRLGNYAEVHSLFEQAVAVDPRDANLFQNVGALSYFSGGRHQDAVRAYRRALELAPDQVGWRVGLGELYFYAEGQLDSLRTAVSLASRTGPVAAAVTLAYLERDWDAYLRAATAVDSRIDIASAHQRLGNEIVARAMLDSIRVGLEPLLRERLDVPARIEDVRFETWDAARLLAGRLGPLGWAYVGLGRPAEVMSTAGRIAELSRVDDAGEGLILRTNAARMLAAAGLADSALDLLEDLAATPRTTSAHALRLDPAYDPIREHPRFQALLASRG